MARVYAILIENGRMKITDVDESLRDEVIKIIREDGYEIDGN